MSERLHKVLAHAGIASRRASERLILEGRVTVNGSVVADLGTKVDPDEDAIKVDGKRLAAPPAHKTYLALHKPRGVVTTLKDPEGRPTVGELLRGVRARVYPVGRLDYDSEGLILLTDDGEMARDLMHPASGVEKRYLVKVRGRPDTDALEIAITEGRNRQVRRMLQAIGHPVQRLRRTAYGGVALGTLPVGALRALTPSEVSRLRLAVRAQAPARRK
jgi:16S rRNA U516 pseudouridylate synthase RsuA-like enzyme